MSSFSLTAREVNGVHVLADAGAAEAGVLVAFTDRRGGVSKPPFDSLNLAARVGDDADLVAENRRRAGEAAGFDDTRLVLARQVHGARALEATGEAYGVIGEADVLITRKRGHVIGILTADCVPAIVWGSKGLAIAHAGWRGLVAGAVESAVDAVGEPRAAWLGPAIRACCYEVGPEVIAEFEGAGLPIAAPDRVDPPIAAAFALRRAGVPEVIDADECTSCSEVHYSYRRDGTTGRQGSFAALV